MKRIVAFFLSLTMIIGIGVTMPVYETSAAEGTPSAEGSNLTEIISISAGNNMSAAVRKDGTLWTWGGKDLESHGSWWGNPWSKNFTNRSLGLAEGSYIENTPMLVFSNSAASVVCSLNVSIYNHAPVDNVFINPPVTAVLKNDNSLWMWGTGNFGVLGDDNESESHDVWKPRKVLDDVVAYDTSGYHSAAVTKNGNLYMWGNNQSGQLGDGTAENKSIPTLITSGVETVSLGTDHSMILKTDGSVWVCGDNSSGQVGNSSTEKSMVFVKVLNGIQQISAGGKYSTALTSSGDIYVWGDNYYGQLGLGNFSNQSVPVMNENFDGDILNIDAGDTHCAAIQKNGALWMWGGNNDGQLGNSSFEPAVKPFILMKNVKMVSLGMRHSMAVTSDNRLLAWGDNDEGQLGVDRVNDRRTPAEVKLGHINVSFQGDNMETSKLLYIPWEDTWLHDESTNYNHNMALSGIVLSESIYRWDKEEEVLKQFGYRMASYGISNGIHPAYSVGYKITWDFDTPTIHIIMVIRGTKTDAEDGAEDIMENLRSVRDSFDSAGEALVTELQNAENNILRQLQQDNISVSLTRKNTKYYLTGHSLGGACAGKLGMMLLDKGLASDKNLYVYTFAAPNNNTDPYKTKMVSRLFNIINIYDEIVPNVPLFMYNKINFKIPMWRLGYDLTLLPSENNQNFMSSLYELYGEYPADWRSPAFKAHMTPVYLAALLAYVPKAVKNEVFSKAKMIAVECPVDVEVYDENNNLCAYTKGGETYYSEMSPVIVDVIGEGKYIQIPDSRKYTIKYIGTGTGTMRVSNQVFDIETQELESQTVYENVKVTEGKLFSGSTNEGGDLTEINLYVVDSDNNKISSVAEDGTETMLAKYDIKDIDVQIGTEAYQYDGTEKTQEVFVPDLTEGQDYKILYKDNTQVGIATVTVKGINDYTGEISKSFEIYNKGTCGESIVWSLSADGNLTLSGQGNIPDYNSENAAPWIENNPSIKKVHINEGITSIGENAFTNCEGLTDVILPKNLVSIGTAAFSNCNNLGNIYFAGSEDEWSGIAIGENNEVLQTATIFFNSEGHIHSLVKTEEIAPSCLSEGHIAYWNCDGCGKLFTDEKAAQEISCEDTILKALDHNWGEWTVVTPATVDAEGLEERVCNNDPMHKETRVIPKLESVSIKGNVNGDKSVDAKDLTALARHVAGIVPITDEELLKAADVNSDGAVDAKDLTHLARYVAGIIPEL